MRGYDYAIKNNTVFVKDLDKADRNFKYMLPCGHYNGVIPNVWPFDTMICTTCKARTKITLRLPSGFV